MASLNCPFPTAPRRSRSRGESIQPPGPLIRAQELAAELDCKLCALDFGDLADLFFPIAPIFRGYTRLHGWHDAGGFQRALAELQSLQPRRSSKAVANAQTAGSANDFLVPPSATEVHNAPLELRAIVTEICAVAGLRSDAAIDVCLRSVRGIANYIYGCCGCRFGKERKREFAGILATAKSLLVALPKLRRWALTDARTRGSSAVLLRLEPLLTTLEDGVRRVIHHATRQRDEAELGAPGGAPVPDPVLFGAERMMSIWQHHRKTTPTHSRNRGGFLVFGGELLQLAVDIQGTGRPAWIKDGTFETALRQQVRLAQQSNPA
jgi:hypothetical protein